MVGSLIKHGRNSCVRIMRAVVALGKGRITFSAFLGEIGTGLSSFWRGCVSRPATPQRSEAMAHVNEGCRLYNQKDYQAALVFFRAAADEDPAYGRALLYVGNALYKLAQHSEAYAMWERVLSVDPGSKSALDARTKMDKMHFKNQQAIIDLQVNAKQR